MQLAEQRIDEAERADAQRYANRELNMAREKLLQAREAQEDGDEERAARLAEQAELDAAYALALAENESVQSAVDELRATLATLESELERQEDPSVGAPSDEGDIDVSLRESAPPDEPRDPAPLESDPLRPDASEPDPLEPDPLEPDPLDADPPSESPDAGPGPRL